MQSKTALLVGASGLVGRDLIRFILESNYYAKVISLGRTSLSLQDERLEEHLIDFKQLSSYEELIQADDIFCTLGTTLRKAKSIENFFKVDFSYPLEVATIAHKNGATRFFVVTSLGANTQSKNYYLRAKGELEKALEKIPFESLHIFRPSLLVGDREEIRWKEDLMRVLMTAFAPFIPARYKGIQSRTVAKFMQEIAVNASEKKEKPVVVYESNTIHRLARKRFDLNTFQEKTYYKPLK